MMRHSYRVQVAHEKIKRQRLLIDLYNNPDNERAKEMLEQVEQSIAWYEKQIADGKDPGVHTL